MFSTVYRIWEVGHCIRCGMCECGCDVCMVGCGGVVRVLMLVTHTRLCVECVRWGSVVKWVVVAIV